jgi:hypothetical protein
MTEPMFAANEERRPSNGGVDRSLLRENLKLTVTERFRKHRQVAQFVEKLRAAGKVARKRDRL